jgi:hypothetical protein
MGFYSGDTAATDSLIPLLTDAVQIWTPAGETEPAIDPVTFEATYPDPVYLWEGPGLFQPAASSTEQRAGGGPVRVVEDTVKVPPKATGFRVGDSLRVASQIGEEFEIVRIESRTNEILRTLRVRSRRDVAAPS